MVSGSPSRSELPQYVSGIPIETPLWHTASSPYHWYLAANIIGWRWRKPGCNHEIWMNIWHVFSEIPCQNSRRLWPSFKRSSCEKSRSRYKRAGKARFGFTPPWPLHMTPHWTATSHSAVFSKCQLSCDNWSSQLDMYFSSFITSIRCIRNAI